MIGWIKGLLFCSWLGHAVRTEATLWSGRTVPVAPYCLRCRRTLVA